MKPSVNFFSLIAFAAAAFATAIPPRWQQYGLPVARRQIKNDTATVPTFNYGPFSTVLVTSGPAASATNSQQPASDTTTRSIAGSKAPLAISSTLAGTVTVPTFNYFPSSTVPVGPAHTGQPSVGDGSNSRGGDGSGNGGGGTGDNSPTKGTPTGVVPGAGNGSGNDPQTGLPQDLTDLLEGLLSLLGS
ncbi:hypothetical protein F4777DRAFT_127226 [Nemania sp. FL0916]|nr:hypothetical protein F4777DRAFT_127226 [Nemania sp. FL0916]